MEKLFGIDISHWQGDMSIEQARNERGVKFAIIRLSGITHTTRSKARR